MIVTYKTTIPFNFCTYCKRGSQGPQVFYYPLFIPGTTRGAKGNKFSSFLAVFFILFININIISDLK